MADKRKTAVPVDEPDIFTDELPAATSFTLQSEDEFFAGAAKRIREFQEGRRTKAVARESFESLEALLLAVLNPTRQTPLIPSCHLYDAKSGRLHQRTNVKT